MLVHLYSHLFMLLGTIDLYNALSISGIDTGYILQDWIKSGIC